MELFVKIDEIVYFASYNIQIFDFEIERRI